MLRVGNTEELLPNSQLCFYCSNQSDTVPQQRRALIGQISLTLSVFGVGNTEELLPYSQLCFYCSNQSDTVHHMAASSYWSDYVDTLYL
jgi:hypothetical protein